MPAKSGKQRRAAGMALAIKRGQAPASKAGKAVRQMAGMSEDQLKDFAKKKKKKK